MYVSTLLKGNFTITNMNFTTFTDNAYFPSSYTHVKHFQFQNDAYMKVCLQCKLYKAGETSHSHWGQKLCGIHVDCKMEEGHNYITVLNEKYL